MDEKIINGLLVDRASVSIREILYQCYKSNPDSLGIIMSDVSFFVESLKSENNG